MLDVIILFNFISFFFTLVGQSQPCSSQNLLAPPPIQLAYHKCFSSSYLKALDYLDSQFPKTSPCKQYINDLRKTIDRQKANGLIEKIACCRDAILLQENLEYANAMHVLKEAVSKFDFSGCSTDVMLTADFDKRLYSYSWFEQGEKVTKDVKMIPKMYLHLSASYDERTNSYYYTIINESGSEASVNKLFIDNAFPRCESIVSEFRKKNLSKTKLENHSYMAVNVPTVQSLSNFFTFTQIDSKSNMLVNIQPGEKSRLPYIFNSIEVSLPGIVVGSVRISATEFNPLGPLGSEEFPELARFTANGGSLDQYHFRHRGKTIGPVPHPACPDSAEFKALIRSYISTAAEEGWFDPASHQDMIAAIVEILGHEGDLQERQKDLRHICDMVKTRHEQGLLCNEVFALLYYNLSFLLQHLEKEK